MRRLSILLVGVLYIYSLKAQQIPQQYPFDSVLYKTAARTMNIKESDKLFKEAFSKLNPSEEDFLFTSDGLLRWELKSILDSLVGISDLLSPVRYGYPQSTADSYEWVMYKKKLMEKYGWGKDGSSWNEDTIVRRGKRIYNSVMAYDSEYAAKLKTIEEMIGEDIYYMLGFGREKDKLWLIEYPDTKIRYKDYYGNPVWDKNFKREKKKVVIVLDDGRLKQARNIKIIW